MTRRLPRAEPLHFTFPIIPELPTSITMSDGKEYNVAGDVWILPEDPGHAATVKINWTLLTRVFVGNTTTHVMSARAVSLVKLYTLEKMGTVGRAIKPSSGKGILRAMLDFARWLTAHPERLPIGREFDWGDLTADLFESWLLEEYRKKRKGNSAQLVRRFYIWGADPDVNQSGFSNTLASVLSAQCIKNNTVGELVESRDKKRGPFTREELDLLFQACETGKGKAQDRALAWIFLLTAIRPKQVYNLTNRDLEICESVKEGELENSPVQATYRIRVRKIKRRGNVIEYHYLPLSEGCARLLLSLRRPESGPDDPLFWWVSSFYSEFILRRLRAFSKDANLRSRRLCIANPDPGSPLYDLMPVTPRRFRYGITTDRIARGESPEDVAEMLGHKGIRKIHAYIETSPGIADDFQRATDYAIAPLIDLMEGRSHPSEVCLSDANIPLLGSPKLREYNNAWEFRRGSVGQYYVQYQGQSLPEDVFTRSTYRSDISEDRVIQLIARARNKFPMIYPNQDFSGQLWSVIHLRERPSANSLVNFGFTMLGTNVGSRNRFSSRPKDALPTYFAEVIKSWLVISSNVSVGYNAGRLLAARYFWNFLSTQWGKRSASFVWGELSEEDFLAFEQFLGTYRTRGNQLLNPNTILQIIFHIQCLVDFLTSYGICRHIDYISQIPLSRKTAARLVDEKQLMAKLKLPAPGALESLACIYHRLTTASPGNVSDRVLLLISAVAILMLTGLRKGELITLPFDCEVEEKLPKKLSGEPDTYRYGIRYWVEKAKKTTMRIKWISPTAEPIVRASIARIKRLTSAARERARVLEADPAKVTLPPEIASRTVITRAELLALIGQKTNRSFKSDPQRLLPQHGKGCNSYYYVKDLEAYLLSRRVPYLYTIRHDDSTVQMLSESLFIMFAKQTRCWQTDPCFLLVEPVKADAINYFLSSKTDVFKTYGDVGWQKRLSANPHCFRHWLIHIAYNGGMETHLLLRYFAKRYASGVADYLHFTTNESDAYAPGELCAEQFYVPVQRFEG